MDRYEVWAPTPSLVELVVDGERFELRRSPAGWWSTDAVVPEPGARYGFALDGGPVRPDPRSASQPDGPDGLSAWIDHEFAWTDGDWRGVALAGAVLYELHVGTFTPNGTFDDAIERLPYLRALGIDAVEVMPVAEFSGSRGWGYDGVDLYAPHSAYGGPQAMKRFVDACHAHGIGVVLDVVYNHLGPSGNYLAEFGPYFSERHHTNWGPAVNLDGPGSDEVRRYVVDNALMWLRDYHVDGLRLDAVHALVDDSATHLLEELAGEVDALAASVGRPLFLIGESDLNDPKFVRSRDAGGYGLTAAWADEWHHALRSVLTGETDGYYADFGTLHHLAKALRQAWVYDGIWSPHRGRHHGRSPGGLSGHRFVVCTQNHDQVGNRAEGDRPSLNMSPGRLRIAAALLLTSPFTPMLFQGEEWGTTTPFQYFTDHADPDLGRAVSEGRRNEFSSFGWDPADVPDPQEVTTYRRSVLDWSEADAEPHRTTLAWYQGLIELRRRYPCLSDPRLDRIEVDVDVEARTLVVRRGEIDVLVNLGLVERTVAYDGMYRIVAAPFPDVSSSGGRVVVPPDSVVLVERAPSPR